MSRTGVFVDQQPLRFRSFEGPDPLGSDTMFKELVGMGPPTTMAADRHFRSVLNEWVNLEALSSDDSRRLAQVTRAIFLNIQLPNKMPERILNAQVLLSIFRHCFVQDPRKFKVSTPESLEILSSIVPVYTTRGSGRFFNDISTVPLVDHEGLTIWMPKLGRLAEKSSFGSVKKVSICLRDGKVAQGAMKVTELSRPDALFAALTEWILLNVLSSAHVLPVRTAFIYMDTRDGSPRKVPRFAMVSDVCEKLDIPRKGHLNEGVGDIIEVVRCLVWIHSAGVGYSDSKFDNFFKFEGKVVASDFGQSIFLNVQDVGVHLPIRVGGRFPAPELAECRVGEGVLPDIQKIDVFPVGVMLYQILAANNVVDSVGFPTDRQWRKAPQFKNPSLSFCIQATAQLKKVQKINKNQPLQAGLMAIVRVTEACLARDPTHRPTVDVLFDHLTGIGVESNRFNP